MEAGEVSYLSKAVRMGWVCAGYFCCITNHPKLIGIKQKCFIMFMESVGQHNEREYGEWLFFSSTTSGALAGVTPMAKVWNHLEASSVMSGAWSGMT